MSKRHSRDHIDNNQLKVEDLPLADADWRTIAIFALSYNGYEVHGAFEKCAEIANARRHGTLSELRTCLFFEQRRWTHFGTDPDDAAIAYMRSLVEKIRHKVILDERD